MTRSTLPSITAGSIKGDGGNGGGGIGTNAGQAKQRGFGVGEAAVVIRCDRPCAFQQVPGACVIAKPGPFPHDRRVIGGCQIAHGWPKCGEAVEICLDRSNGGLLQHDLGQPDAIWVRHDPGRAICGADAPRQRARVAIIPVQKGRAVRVVTQGL